jgi:hypothetical protein
MGAQELIVIALFAVAMFYIGSIIYRNLQPKKGCGSNCKCGVDFSDLKIPEEKSN